MFPPPPPLIACRSTLLVEDQGLAVRNLKVSWLPSNVLQLKVQDTYMQLYADLVGC